MGGLFGRPRRDDAMTSDALDGLLEEMRDLRLMLAADLNAAAGAAEAGEEGVAAEIVEADRGELARFARVADQRLLRLQGLAVARRSDAPSWKRRVAVALPVVPVVGALAVSAAAATGVLPIPGNHAKTTSQPPAVAQPVDTSAPADSTFRNLVSVLGSDPSKSQVIAAASKLHRQLAKLIATSPNDPQGAATVAELLRAEQNLLMREQPPGAKAVLSATRKLAKRLATANHLSSPSPASTLLPTIDPSPRPHRSTSQPTTTKKKSSPKPSSSTSSKPPSSSPSPSHTPFPAIPGG